MVYKIFSADITDSRRIFQRLSEIFVGKTNNPY